MSRKGTRKVKKTDSRFDQIDDLPSSFVDNFDPVSNLESNLNKPRVRLTHRVSDLSLPTPSRPYFAMAGKKEPAVPHPSPPGISPPPPPSQIIEEAPTPGAAGNQSEHSNPKIPATIPASAVASGASGGACKKRQAASKQKDKSFNTELSGKDNTIHALDSIGVSLNSMFGVIESIQDVVKSGFDDTAATASEISYKVETLQATIAIKDQLLNSLENKVQRLEDTQQTIVKMLTSIQENIGQMNIRPQESSHEDPEEDEDDEFTEGDTGYPDAFTTCLNLEKYRDIRHLDFTQLLHADGEVSFTSALRALGVSITDPDSSKLYGYREKEQWKSLLSNIALRYKTAAGFKATSKSILSQSASIAKLKAKTAPAPRIETPGGLPDWMRVKRN